MKKLFIVYANTHEGGYGALISLFGVFDTKEEATEVCNKIPNGRGQMEEVILNESKEIYLGGYFE